MRISDWSSDVCSSDLVGRRPGDRLDARRLPDPGPRPHLRVEVGGLDVALLDLGRGDGVVGDVGGADLGAGEIGRASCRERVCQYVWISVVAVSLKKKSEQYLMSNL